MESSLHDGEDAPQTTSLIVESGKQFRKHAHSDTLDAAPHSLNNTTAMYATAAPTKNFFKEDVQFGNQTSVLVADSFLNKNRLPKIPACAQKYVPMPYTFRVPTSGDQYNNIKNGRAQSPPFCLQLDHTLCVVWCLFSKINIKKPLGIVQLQWALSFLKTIVNRRGDHPKDVEVCIQAIQDELIQQYGDMVDEVQLIEKAHKKHVEPKSKKRHSKSSVTEETNDLSLGGTIVNSTMNEHPSHYLSVIDDSMPFSVNYTDIVRNTPVGNATFTLNKTRSGKSMSAETPSRDNMVGFLKAWRQEQIDKIQSELQRLHSIENFIGNCEKDNFEPYLPDKDLQVILSEKTKRNGSTSSVGKKSK